MDDRSIDTSLLDRFRREGGSHGRCRTTRGAGPPAGSPILLRHALIRGPRGTGVNPVAVAEIISNLVFTGPLTWTDDAGVSGPERAVLRPGRRAPGDPGRPRGQGPRRLRRAARSSCRAATGPARSREYGFWGGESEEERAAAGYRVDMPVGRVARYPEGQRHAGAPTCPARRLTPRPTHRAPRASLETPVARALVGSRDARRPALGATARAAHADARRRVLGLERRRRRGHRRRRLARRQKSTRRASRPSTPTSTSTTSPVAPQSSSSTASRSRSRGRPTSATPRRSASATSSCCAASSRTCGGRIVLQRRPRRRRRDRAATWSSPSAHCSATCRTRAGPRDRHRH